ncbi:Major Facilitator Superfamily protein [Coccidioides posadasii C735 delta SOWgp]|uniref:Major Facilitator Superfamily protein n=1 Tax=Coccidioides posadasii (strain C735) TaxID=222929 RepID=C5PED6_COCP7|nr:Major Facilitator Superfamily protein [Coccidioides posadasii C735 delta SOWgp]EER24764.1 Major Facilitator Superfamily protein [Coccidioides posadasii C735 delta SOWgp]|eukprot:XP_003066909.1 Major Facilitator Superfamily protein [Coccidioides posadasii C735 delta SOWgp]
MGLGVLDDRKLDHVPGTTYVLDDDSSSIEQIPSETSHLKYDRSGPVPIILVPQPSDDPNDPLNWPLWRRDLILTILSLISVICATTSPLMAANTVTIAAEFERTFTDIALLTGYHLCAVGVAGFLFVPTARIWGKRHLFLLGNVIIIFSCAWAGASGTNYKSLLAARIFQGIGLAPFEALVNAAVGDLYFVHERGKRMAVSNVALFGGAFLTPVLVGKITASMGWAWTFNFVAIFAGLCLPFVFFFVPETAFRRATHLNTDFEGDAERNRNPRDVRYQEEMSNRTSDHSGSGTNGELQTDGKSDSANEKEMKEDTAITGTAGRPGAAKAAFLQSLRLFNGRKTDEDFFKLLLRPLPLFFHLGILWGCLIQGVIIGWTVFIGVVLAALFIGPPLWFNEVKTGYLYTGAFVGSLLGLILSGLLSDWSARVMIKFNRGKYEPEFRIVLVFPMLIFSCAGLYGFGYISGDITRYGWLPADIFFALVIIGMVLGAVASALYLVDAHRQIAVEAFTCLLVFKNMFSFVLTYFAYDWVVHGGQKQVFIIIASIQVGICLLSVPMYILGKRNRSFFHRHDILKILHLW